MFFRVEKFFVLAVKRYGRWMMYYTSRDAPDWMPAELKRVILLNAK